MSRRVKVCETQEEARAAYDMGALFWSSMTRNFPAILVLAPPIHNPKHYAYLIEDDEETRDG